MSDSPNTEFDGGASPPAEMDVPDGADSEEFTGDGITAVTPPKPEEGDEALEAGLWPTRSARTGEPVSSSPAGPPATVVE